MSRKGNTKQRARIDGTGLVDGWKSTRPSQVDTAPVNPLIDDDDSLVKHGGLIPDDEMDEVEGAAAQHVKPKGEDTRAKLQIFLMHSRGFHGSRLSLQRRLPQLDYNLVSMAASKEASCH